MLIRKQNVAKKKPRDSHVNSATPLHTPWPKWPKWSLGVPNGQEKLNPEWFGELHVVSQKKLNPQNEIRTQRLRTRDKLQQK